jgi:hypothetical protein
VSHERDPWFAGLRERAWIRLARFAIARANRVAPLHYGQPPYLLSVPVREKDIDVDCDIWPANSHPQP